MPASLRARGVANTGVLAHCKVAAKATASSIFAALGLMPGTTSLPSGPKRELEGTEFWYQWRIG